MAMDRKKKRMLPEGYGKKGGMLAGRGRCDIGPGAAERAAETAGRSRKRRPPAMYAVSAAARGIAGILCDLLFPRCCPVCDRPAPPGKAICPECTDRLIPIREPRCQKCGRQLGRDTEEYCHDCRSRKHIYDRGVVLYPYASCREIIYRFKYSGRREYAPFLGEAMARQLGGQILAWRPDALIPVPLHRSRQRKRGYNQAALLARVLGSRLGIPVLEEYLVRVKKTRPQKELDGAMRQNNLKKAFKIVQDDVKLKTIVVIDDIYTTGSTMDAVAQVCRDAGVSNIFFAALSAGSTGRDLAGRLL